MDHGPGAEEETVYAELLQKPLTAFVAASSYNLHIEERLLQFYSTIPAVLHCHGSADMLGAPLASVMPLA
jgi:hypothetical protein